MRIEYALTIVGLLLLSTNPGFTQGENQINLLLCGAMSLSPLVLLLRKTRVFLPRVDTPLLLVCITVFAAPLLFHPDSIRLSTMLFTCAYCVFTMMLAGVLRVSGLQAHDLMKLIRAIIYAFTIVLVIQQVCVLMGWPVFCEGKRYMESYRLNSLTAEPSHTSVTLGALMFIYTQTFRVAEPQTSLWSLLKREWPMWFCWAWTLFSTVNASAFVLAPLAFLPFLNRRNVVYVAGTVVILLGIIWFSPLGEKGQIGRVKRTAEAIITLDEKRIIDADESASARIVPTIRGAKALRQLDVETLTGHGVDADIHDLEPRPCDEWERGFAGLFSMWHNYGALCALAFWCAIGILTIVPGRPWSLLTFLFAMQMSADYNMQLVWMIMAFGMVFKYSVCRDRKLLQAIPTSRG